MTDIPFEYIDFETTRAELIRKVNQVFNNSDKDFLISFESGSPDLTKCGAGDLSYFPSIQWKLKNILTLKQKNPSKYKEAVEKLRQFLFNENV